MLRSARSILDDIRTHGRTLAIAGAVGMVGLGGLASLRGERSETLSETTAIEAAAAAEASATAELALAGASWDLPNLDHPRVDYWVARFDTVPDMREKFEGFLVRSGWFHDMIAAKLAERGMPQDLVYLAMIESGFQPKAYSHAAASGIWQFISETGRRYGLQIDGQVDERNHPEKATEAALDYLEELHDRFDSWYLAAAAYNSGENRVGRIMREEFGTEKAFGEGAYYRIWDRLPRETRDYVPLMIAAARIAKEPGKYGFDHVQRGDPWIYEEVVTDAALTLDQIADAAGVEADLVKLYNPHFKDGRLPGDRRVAVRLPVGAADDFQKHWPEFVAKATVRTASAPAATASTYRVRRGDNLTAIARRHGMTVSEVRRINGLRSDRIYAGQTLRVAAR